MIIDYDKVSKHISRWIREYAENNNKDTLIVHLYYSIPSLLTALLCKQTRLPLLCIQTYSDCVTSGIIDTFVDKFNIKQAKLNIETGQIFEDCLICGSIIKPAKSRSLYKAPHKLNHYMESSLLSFLAHAYNGLVIGSLTRSEYGLIRNYEKYGDGDVDLLPIADLYNGEVFALFDNLSDFNTNTTSPFAYNKETFLRTNMERNKGISDDELEWADKQNIKEGIIIDNRDPVKHKAWLRYTKRQREVIALIHQLEKLSRHKHNPSLPICNIRDKKWLIK